MCDRQTTAQDSYATAAARIRTALIFPDHCNVDERCGPDPKSMPNRGSAAQLHDRCSTDPAADGVPDMRRRARARALKRKRPPECCSADLGDCQSEHCRTTAVSALEVALQRGRAQTSAAARASTARASTAGRLRPEVALQRGRARTSAAAQATARASTAVLGRPRPEEALQRGRAQTSAAARPASAQRTLTNTAAQKTARASTATRLPDCCSAHDCQSASCNAARGSASGHTRRSADDKVPFQLQTLSGPWSQAHERCSVDSTKRRTQGGCTVSEWA